MAISMNRHLTTSVLPAASRVVVSVSTPPSLAARTPVCAYARRMSRHQDPASGPFRVELDAVRGASALAVRAVQGITDLVEEMHGAIAGLSPPIAANPAQPKTTRGIARWVYRSVRGVTGVVGWGMNRSLDVAQLPLVSEALAPALGRIAVRLKLTSAEPYREPVRAALNGVLGDILADTANPLAIDMRFRQRGRALEASRSNGKLLIMVHGLCMNDLQWLRDGHDHGAMLAERLGWETIYLHYNSGRRVTENGADFADLLEHTLGNWPVPITQLAIVGHSMGGLIARSACHHALLAQQRWIQHLGKLVTLATPHAGAPLERAGRRVDLMLGASPYTAPFARLGAVRSAGIQSLRHGHVTASGESPLWPGHVKLYALACTRQKATEQHTARSLAQPLKRLVGDGLVPVKSALGQTDKPALGLPLNLPASRRAVVHQTDHFELLGSQEVAKYLLRWLRG
jgi:pimeloyl-ACP methyl ester carboxylesterase